MMQTGWKRLGMVALVGATLLVGASESKAGWWWGGYYARGWTACYGGYCGGYLVPRGGPLRRMFLGPYRYVPAYYTGYSTCYWPTCCGPCYSTCCDPCYSCCDPCYSSCCCVTYDCCSPAATSVVVPSSAAPASASPTPAAPPQQAPAPAAGSPTPAPGAQGAAGAQPTTMLEVIPEATRQGSGLITIWVPYDAQVFVNGMETKSNGSRRRYVSYGLVDGYRYKYEITARILRGDQVLEEKETVVLSAGDDASVAFGFNPKPEEELAQNF